MLVAYRLILSHSVIIPLPNTLTKPEIYSVSKPENLYSCVLSFVRVGQV